jgi:hypothetical protein
MPAVVACGNSHTCSISRRGELFTWGLASSGELGHAAWTPIEVPVPRQCYLTSPTLRIVSVAAGSNHTLAISETGTLWSCGRGRQGQLGHGAFNDEPNLLLIHSLQVRAPGWPRPARAPLPAALLCTRRGHDRRPTPPAPRSTHASSRRRPASPTPWRSPPTAPSSPGATGATGSWATRSCR